MKASIIEMNSISNIELLFNNIICNPISNFDTLYGIQNTNKNDSVFNKNISRLVNGTRQYKVIQL